MLFVLALSIGLAFAVALVRAAAPGQDFEWLSVSEGGILLGASGGEGEGEGEAEPAPPHTVLFAPRPARTRARRSLARRARSHW